MADNDSGVRLSSMKSETDTEEAADEKPPSVQSSKHNSASQARKSKKNFEVEEDLDDNPVLSVDNLTQWLINFSSTSAALLRTNISYFRDEFNVLRNSQWQFVRESQNPLAAAATQEMGMHHIKTIGRELNFNEIQTILDKTGCISLPIVLFESPQSDDIRRYETAARRRSSARVIPALDVDHESPGVYRRHCLFLSDWQRLWNFLKNDQEDEVALHLPYLRTCVEFFFHRRTVQLMYFLVAWNIGVAIMAQIWFHKGISVYSKNFNYAYNIFQLAVYLVACQMNKGTLPKFFEVNPFGKQKRKVELPKPDVDDTEKMNARTHHVHWGSSARMIGRNTCSELYHFFQSVKEESENTRNFSRRGMYYYKWMNMMMKMLTRMNGLDVSKTNFNRQIYRFVLIFSTVVYPLYCLFYVWGGYANSLFISCYKNVDGTKNSQCEYYFVIMSGTGGFFTIWLQLFIYGASVLISLAGLAYGGEIAYRLADAWLQKFGCLRRVDDFDSCYVDRDAINKVQGNAVNEELAKKHAAVGRAIRIANGFRMNSTIMETEDKEKKEFAEQSSKEITSLISRDATEQYLFIREAMNTAGRIWSPVITGLMFLALFIAVAQIFEGIYDTRRGYGNVWLFIRLTVFVIIRLLVLVFYPILSIASANAYLLKIGDVFTVSAEEDYEVIGGRDRWLEFLDKFPAVWTYYGVYITPERLAGIAWTTFIAFLSVVFTALASTSL
jgi:hypothetical protein